MWITVESAQGPVKGSQSSTFFTGMSPFYRPHAVSVRGLSFVCECERVPVDFARCMLLCYHGTCIRISVLMHGHAALSRRTDRGSPGQLADGEPHIQTTVSHSILRTARLANTNTRIAIARRRRGTKVGSAEANCVRRASSWPTAVQHSAICEHWSFCQRGRAAPEDTKPP